MSDVQDEVFQEAVPSPSAANEALDSSIPSEGGGQVPSVPPVSEGDTVTNAEIAELCQVPGFVEACLGRFLSCCCVFVFCLLRCDSAQGEVRAACVVPVDPG